MKTKQPTLKSLSPIACMAVSLLMISFPSLAFAGERYFVDNALVDGILSTVVYSGVGIVMASLAYKVIDFLTPGDLSKDIANNNFALATLAGFFMLGICVIIAAVLAS